VTGEKGKRPLLTRASDSGCLQPWSARKVDPQLYLRKEKRDPGFLAVTANGPKRPLKEEYAGFELGSDGAVGGTRETFERPRYKQNGGGGPELYQEGKKAQSNAPQTAGRVD